MADRRAQIQAEISKYHSLDDEDPFAPAVHSYKAAGSGGNKYPGAQRPDSDTTAQNMYGYDRPDRAVPASPLGENSRGLSGSGGSRVYKSGGGRGYGMGGSAKFDKNMPLTKQATGILEGLITNSTVGPSGRGDYAGPNNVVDEFCETIDDFIDILIHLCDSEKIQGVH